MQNEITSCGYSALAYMNFEFDLDLGFISEMNSKNLHSRQKSIHFYFYSRYEQEKFRIMIENGQLEKDKLQRESNWMEVQVQLAQTELALKKQECQEKGIIIQN